MSSASNIYKTVYSTSRKGRRKIKTSQGELQCMDLLKEAQIPFTKQVRLPKFGRIRYDFQITYQDVTYLVELDGEQHFTFTPTMHKNLQKFKRNQTRDIVKTLVPILRGYCVVRIAYKDRNYLLEHLHNAFVSDSPLYVSDINKYAWLLEAPIRPNWIKKYSPNKC